MFEEIGEDTVLGYNIGIKQLGNTTKGVVGNWADPFTNISPTLALSVDTSALGYYDTARFSRFITTNLQTSAEVTVDGFEETMEQFYREHMQATTMTQIADDTIPVPLRHESSNLLGYLKTVVVISFLTDEKLRVKNPGNH